MAARPAKRQKRLVVQSSPEHGSPEKPRPANATSRKEERTRPITTFFSASTQSEPQHQRDDPRSLEVPEEDLIQDDFDDEELSRHHATIQSSTSVSSRASLGKPVSRSVPKAMARFKTSGHDHEAEAPLTLLPDGSEEAYGRPWAERFAPTSLDELAVHKKKVADVRGWLADVLNGRARKRLLVLKGAAGSGKTTTVSLLAESMDIDVLEWRNPVGAAHTMDGHASMSAQFDEFLGRSARFGGLTMSRKGLDPDDHRPSPDSEPPSSQRKKIILIEEFPNTFARSSIALSSFRSSIQQYLASSAESNGIWSKSARAPDPTPPLIMIISETLLTTLSTSADSFTAHRLLGPEILGHPAVGVIEFNPIARTLLAKALGLVIQKESRRSGRRKTPGRLVLEKLGEVGDIRSAVGSLEFLCVRGDDGEEEGWSAKVHFGRAKKAVKDNVSLTKMERESLELVTQREASLGIFHAVGKVVYNKRDEVMTDSLLQPELHLPEHLSRHSRPKASQVRVDELIDETGTDSQTFLAALHENYILSCESPSLDASFDSINGCMDGLSDGDLLSRSWASGRGNVPGITSDTLRQDEISFQVAVRSVLFALPHPVKRRVSTTSSQRGSAKASDAFKMFYPTSLKLWRSVEEVQGLVDVWIDRFRQPSGLMVSPVSHRIEAKSKPGIVESWKSKAQRLSHDDTTSTDAALVPLSGGSAARCEMLLERLPYLAKMDRLRLLSSSARRELERTTSFQGIDGQSDDFPDSDEPGPERSSNGRAVFRPHQTVDEPDVWQPGEQDMQHLVLSDDDIEDG